MLLPLHRVIVPAPFLVFVAPAHSHVLHFETEALPTTRSYDEVRSNA